MEKPVKRTKRAKSGDVLRIPMDETRWSYGQVTEDQSVVVYNIITTEEVDISTVSTHPFLFRIHVMRSALNGKEWPVVGHLPLSEELQHPAEFLSMRSDYDREKFYGTVDGSVHYPIPRERVNHLELLSVYEPIDVSERLFLHAQGKPDPSVEAMRIKE